MKFLEGAVAEDVPRDAEYDGLRDEVRQLRQELASAKREADAARRDTARALAALRKQLGPLYQALQMVFGELDAAGVDDQPAASGTNPRTVAVWENWKSKLGVGAGKVIEALLLHGELNTQQISVATGYHRNTVPQYVSQLNKNGLITKNAGKFSLKKLS